MTLAHVDLMRDRGKQSQQIGFEIAEEIHLLQPDGSFECG
jgi:hypothetical protein